MGLEELDSEERDLIYRLRAARGRDSEPLPTITDEEFTRYLKVKAGCGVQRREKVLETWRRITRTLDGPRIVITGTLAALEASWRQHEEWLIETEQGAYSLRHSRDAVTHYCRALGVRWRPETTIYEKRGRDARTKRAHMRPWPDQPVERLRRIVHELRYHDDAHVQAGYQVRARVGLHIAPRPPSEDSRIRVQDVYPERGVIVLHTSKTSGPESTVLIPREVWGVSPTVLSHPKRKSVAWYVEHHRARLLDRLNARVRPGALAPAVCPTCGASSDCLVDGRVVRDGIQGGRQLWYCKACPRRFTEPPQDAAAPAYGDHGYLYVGPRGRPMDPAEWRTTFGLVGKQAWPDWKAYTLREVGIVMRALEMMADNRGHLDVLKLSNWTGHESLDKLRGYMRRAERMMMELGGRPADLKTFLNEWRMV